MLSVLTLTHKSCICLERENARVKSLARTKHTISHRSRKIIRYDPKNTASIPFSIPFFLLAIVFVVFDVEIVHYLTWEIWSADCSSLFQTNIWSKIKSWEQDLTNCSLQFIAFWILFHRFFIKVAVFHCSLCYQWTSKTRACNSLNVKMPESVCMQQHLMQSPMRPNYNSF